MKLSEMRECLAREGIRLTKSLGQNFLHDANQLRRIAGAAELSRRDKVLEIGPGLGPLTELLLEQAGEILAIEKDARLVKLLRERISPPNTSSPVASGGRRRTVGTPVLHLVQDDALEFLARESRDWSDWKLVSNLPYSVASPILVELARGERSPQRLVATLQLEVAKRLVASAGDDDYGVLTLLVQLDFEPGGWFKIPASCFFPAPDVDSACVCLVRRPQPVLAPEQRPTFTRIVKRAFSQRRKMMIKLLKEDWPAAALEAAFRELRLSPQARAEEINREQFIHLTRFLCAAPREEIFDVVNERDEVIARRTRGEVHRLGLLHRAVHVLVFNSRGQVFLQKRSTNKDRQPGLWDSSASGHVDSGEDYDACAVRELREEIGLSLPRPPRRLFKIAACAETDQEFVWVYRCEAEGPFELHPEEIERGDWFAPEEVTRRLAQKPQDFVSAFRLIWEKGKGGATE